MKKYLLFIVILSFGFNLYAQHSYEFKIDTKEQKKIETPAIGIEPIKSPAITKNIIKPDIPNPPNRDVNIVNIIDIGTSANAYGSSGSQKSLVWVDPDLNIVTNFHRMGGDLDVGGYSGDLGYDISLNGGATWTNMVECYVATDNSGGEYFMDAARYPNHGIYNPTNNVDDAFVAFAPNLDGSNDPTDNGWGGYSFGTSDISDPNITTKNLRSSTGDYYQYIPKGYELTTTGEVWVVDENQDWTSGSMVYQNQLIVNHGIWNGSDFDYTASLLDCPTTNNERPSYVDVTFSQDGLTGYIVILANNGAADQIGGRTNLYPIYWKTTDGGDSWTGPSFIQLDGPNGLDRIVNNHLSDADINTLFSPPVPSRDEISYTTAFDMNCAVDNLGNLHIAVVIGPTGTNPYGIVTANGYLAAYDIFTSDRGTSWFAEEMGRISTFRGTFGALTEDNRIQITTNKAGTKVFVSWLDTDVQDAVDNANPNIFCRGFNPTTNMKTVSSSGLDSPTNVTWFSEGMWSSYFFAAPKWCFEGAGSYNIPFVYEDMNPADPAAAVQFKYISDFNFNDADFTIPGNNDYELAHYTPVWSGNPYQPMTIVVNSAQLFGDDMQVGDEIGVFDDDGSGNLICVGATVLTSVLSASNPISITISADDPTTTEIDGFTPSNDIVYKLWNSTDQLEVSNVTAVYDPGFDNNFTILGTAVVSLSGNSHYQTIWEGNPYQPMTILLSEATIDDVDINIGDEIGIFDLDDSNNEICVGVGIVNQTIVATSPFSISASTDDPSTPEIDGFTEGNNIIYKLWNPIEETEYSSFEATYNSSLDEQFTPLGTSLADVNFLTSTTQTIGLGIGWNILSFSVQPEDMDMLNILDPLISSQVLVKVINESGGFIQFIPGVGWMNTIGDMENTEGYYVKVNANTSFDITGMPISPPFIILLSTGWNIMAYPFDQSQNAMDVLQPLIDNSELIKVINESGGFIQYIPGVGWMNTIGNFNPGEGYYIKVNTNTSLTLENPSKTSEYQIIETPKSKYFEKSFEYNPYYPMNIIITDIQLSNYTLSPGDEIGVFDDEICVGVGVIGDDVTLPLTIACSFDDPTTLDIDGFIQGNELSFKYLSPAINTPLDLFYSTIAGTNIFSPLETFVGSLMYSPTLISDSKIQDAVCKINVYPNPSKGNVFIELNSLVEGRIDIELFDIYGNKKEILKDEYISVGTKLINKDLSALPSGIYNIKVIHKSGEITFTVNHKIVLDN